MKIPDRYRGLSVLGYPLNLGELENPEAWPQADVFPPPGFVQAVSLFEFGDGDVIGFYWPIGKENEEPILCETYHDEQSLQPQASGVEGWTRIKVAEGHCEPGDDDHQSAQELATQLGFTLPAADGSEPLPVELQLALDPASPAVLKYAAQQAMKSGDLEVAAEHLRRALDLLPEYTEALILLGHLYRRQGKLPEAAQRLAEAMGAPLCFGWEREKALLSVKRLRDSDYPELAGDPLWSQRQQLTFATGVKRNDDFNIYEEAIAEYLRQGRGVLAVRLRVLVAELMWGETISFRERYSYSMEKHRNLLRSEIEQAGLTDRLIACGPA